MINDDIFLSIRNIILVFIFAYKSLHKCLTCSILSLCILFISTWCLVQACLIKQTITVFLHMTMTGVACSRVEAVCTTHDNRLMRQELRGSASVSAGWAPFLLPLLGYYCSAPLLTTVAPSHNIQTHYYSPNDDQNILLKSPGHKMISEAIVIFFYFTW